MTLKNNRVADILLLDHRANFLRVFGHLVQVIYDDSSIRVHLANPVPRHGSEDNWQSAGCVSKHRSIKGIISDFSFSSGDLARLVHEGDFIGIGVVACSVFSGILHRINAPLDISPSQRDVFTRLSISHARASAINGTARIDIAPAGL